MEELEAKIQILNGMIRELKEENEYLKNEIYDMINSKVIDEMKEDIDQINNKVNKFVKETKHNTDILTETIINFNSNQISLLNEVLNLFKVIREEEDPTL